jgi:hypothetical protein
MRAFRGCPEFSIACNRSKKSKGEATRKEFCWKKLARHNDLLTIKFKHRIAAISMRCFSFLTAFFTETMVFPEKLQPFLTRLVMARLSAFFFSLGREEQDEGKSAATVIVEPLSPRENRPPCLKDTRR